MDLEAAWQAAAGRTVRLHPSLEGTALLRCVGQRDVDWRLHPNVLVNRYSSTEAILVGLLVEIYHQANGLAGVTIPDGADPDHRPSQLVWLGAPAAAALVMNLSDQQRLVIQDLLG